MSTNVELKRGTKVDDQQAARAGGKLGILTTLKLDDEAEGQFRYNDLTQCPYCGNIGYTHNLDSNFFINIVCGRCGMVFRA